ncbi:MAG: hypothetical protein AB1798_06260 [Spirochaetota bacterium]
MPGFARLAAGMHRYGAKCAVQLQHPGRQAALPRDGKLTSNDQAVKLPWSQSREIVYANADEKKKTVHVLTTDEVIELVDLFSEAAWRIMQAGFDAVELHAAHGYLISQFMSPYLNKRNDRFGGSFENRMRFPLAIIDSIQKKCGRNFPVLVRFSVDEWVPGGRELPESIEVARVFEQAGVAALDLSQCIQESPGAGFDPMYYPEGWTIYASEAIKKVVRILIINSHTLRNPEYCEQILAEGKTDLVGLARQLLADPYWPVKVKYGKVRAIRKCISCDWIRYQIEDLKVEVKRSTTPAIEDLKGYDVVVNATGAHSYVPEVSGLKDAVIPFEEVIACPKVTCEFYPQDRKPRKLEGTTIVVWGDHYPAADTVAYLASIGKEVIIITDRKEFASEVEVIHMYVLRKRFKQTDAEALSSKPFKYPVTVYESCLINEIKEGEVIILDRNFQRMTIKCDHVVTCWTKPNTEFLDRMIKAGLPVVNIGRLQKTEKPPCGGKRGRYRRFGSR